MMNEPSIATIMSQAQSFAYSWSLIGNPYADDDQLEKAESEKQKLWNLVQTLIHERDELKAWKDEVEKQSPVAWRWKYNFKDIGETGAYEYHSHEFASVAMLPCGEALYTDPVPPAPSLPFERWGQDVSKMIKTYGDERATEAYHGEFHCRQKPSEVFEKIVAMLSIAPEVTK